MNYIFWFADMGTNTGAADVHVVASDGPIKKMTPVTEKEPSPGPLSLVFGYLNLFSSLEL